MQTQYRHHTTKNIVYECAVKTIIGVHDNEKNTPQTLNIALAIKPPALDTSPDMLKAIIDDFLSKNKSELIETMAYKLALHFGQSLPLISEISITITKPEALPKAKGAFATVVMRTST